ncbi:MAG: spore maturation protein A [Oscillospiraceae bacterium]|nr:spore maturation protein A [Oscillospiraceae bacterium]
MNVFVGALPLLAVIYGIINGRTAEMSAAVLEGAGSAVELILSLCGVMCLWCGVMKVAEKSGIVAKVAGLLSPVVGVLFRGIKKGGRASQLIAMNITANLLGLGNASTPLGLSAMQALKEEEQSTDTATDNMVMLTVLNTASLQLIPTTAAALRAAHGAARPMEILPSVWIVSVYSAAVAIGAAKLMAYIGRRRKRHVDS